MQLNITEKPYFSPLIKTVHKFIEDGEVIVIADYSKMRVSGLRNFIKKHKNEYDRKINITNLTKAQLISLFEEICPP